MLCTYQERLALPKPFHTTAMYGIPLLQLPIKSIIDEYKARKVITVITLRYSKNQRIQEKPSKVRTAKKLKAEDAVDSAIAKLRHVNIVGATQEAKLVWVCVVSNPFARAV